MPKRRGGPQQGRGGGGEGSVEQEGCATKRGCHNAPGGPGLVTSLDKVSYRIESGLRHVEPYDFDFTTHVKQRWVGKTLLEVFTKEFLAYSADYYRASIEAGRVTVDGRRVAPGHVLRDGERIVHRAVRCRENPVLDRGRIRVVCETPELLVVSKPSSLPIHPCGSYRFNSLIAILRAQGTVAPEAELHTTHRLDRLTSGLVILAKTKATARQISSWFQGSEIRKTYLARVRGRFGRLVDATMRQGSAGGLAAPAPAAADSATNTGGEGASADVAARVGAPAAPGEGEGVERLPAEAECVERIPVGVSLAGAGRIRLVGFNLCVDRKVGKYVFRSQRPGVGEDAKDAVTEFEFAGDATNGESLVRCFPSTGRTHQIRVHLLHLGYPIANDSSYGGELRHDPSLPLIPHVYQASNITDGAAEGGADGDGGGDGAPARAEAIGAETTMHPSGIFLHALTYRLPDEEYSSETPSWAECG